MIDLSTMDHGYPSDRYRAIVYLDADLINEWSWWSFTPCCSHCEDEFENAPEEECSIFPHSCCCLHASESRTLGIRHIRTYDEMCKEVEALKALKKSKENRDE